MAIIDLPRLNWSDFTFLGAFGFPVGRDPLGDPSITSGAAGCDFQTTGGPNGGGGIAYNSANNSLFVTNSTTDGWGISEIAIPSTLYAGTDRTLLPLASYIQRCRRVDPYTGRSKDSPNFGSTMMADAYMHSIALHNGRLICSVSNYYDTGAIGRKSVFYLDSTNLLTAQASPLCLIKMSLATNTQGAIMQDIGDGDGLEIHHSGSTTGYMAQIPSEWQAELGNVPVLIGNTGQAIVERQSVGPCAHGFDPDLLSPSTYVRSKLYQQFNLFGPHWGYDTDDPFYVANYGGVVTSWGGPPSDPSPLKRKRFFSPGNSTGCFCPIPGTRTVVETNSGGDPSCWMLYGYNPGGGSGALAGGLPVGHPFYLTPITDSVEGRTGSGNYPVPRHPTDPWGTMVQQTKWERRIRLWDAANFATVFNGSSINQDVARPYEVADWLPAVRRPVQTSFTGAGGAAVDAANRRLYLIGKYDNAVPGLASYPVVDVYTWPSTSPAAPTVVGENSDRMSWGRVA